MLSDKPKLIFSDIGGKVTLEARLPCQQIKQQQQQTHVQIEDRNCSSLFHKETRTPEQAFLTALYNTGEALI